MPPLTTTPRRQARNWPSIQGDPRQRASYALARLEDITRLVAEWVWEVDEYGAFTFVSERITQDLGIVNTTLLGKKFEDFGAFRSHGKDVPAPDWRHPFRDLPFDLTDSDGSVHRLLISGVPIYNPDTWDFEGACGTARDITELRASQETKQNLEEANRLLSETSRAKSSFLAGMSHELRTPLNAILGFSQVIRDEIYGPVGVDQYAEYARDIFESGRHLLALVNDVLDLSKIEAGELTLNEEEFDLREVIDSCLGMLHPLAEGKSLVMHVEAPDGVLPRMRADHRAIRQIFLNLLSNAVKFTPEGGRITTAGGRAEDDRFYVEVRDTGVGIAETDLPEVIKPFNRKNPEISPAEQGAGLGLAITNSLVEKHGGELVLNSTVGVGTTARVLFPAERAVD